MLYPTMSKNKKHPQPSQKDETGKRILSILKSDRNTSFNYKQIAARLQINDSKGRNTIIKQLGILCKKKEIEEISKGSYRLVLSPEYFTGTLEITSRGSAYVSSDKREQDAYIPSGLLGKALHGDEVEVFLLPKRRGASKPEGEVIKIIKRKKTSFVGIVQMQKNFAFVVTSDFRMYTDIFVSKGNLGGAKNGDKVLVEITDWPQNAASPYGKVVNVLGKPGEHHTEMHAILAEYGLPYEFPPDVEHYANQLNTSITKSEVECRRDMRSVTTFTIDPEDAKDFDDALSFQPLQNGHYEIGVHIADVAHYVVPGTPLDEEAARRGTSVYLVDRVVPMLPEILSNNACSLRPHEEKYTFSAIFEVDDQARILNQWFGKTVIYSDRRFTYQQAQDIIEENSLTSPDPITQALLKLNELAIAMRNRRTKNGAISFDKVELKFQLNTANEPVGVYFKEAKDANKLIEEWMLLANKAVAEYIGKQKKTFVYRVHDEPDEDKLIQLNGIISHLGYTIQLKNRNTIANSLNALLNQVKGKKEQHLIDTLAIRSMSKAFYTTENIGHYGLAFEYYTHFTSPIRRYPDIMVHRLLHRYLEKGKSVKADAYEETCKHASKMEEAAASAERASVKYMQIKFMENRQNQPFTGVISGLTEWGMYVEIIENKCEGMVRLRDIRDDYYVFDERQYALVGQVTKNTFELGDEVVVKVKNTDLIKRHLDFQLLGRKEEVTPALLKK